MRGPAWGPSTFGYSERLDAGEKVELLAKLILAEDSVPTVDDNVVPADHYRSGLPEDVVQLPDRLVEAPHNVVSEEFPSSLDRGLEVAPSGDRNKGD